MAVSHVKIDVIPDFTGTVTIFNSQGSTQTLNATDLVRPSDWNSAHNQYMTISGNTLNASTASGTNIQFQGAGNISLFATSDTLIFSGGQSVQTQGSVQVNGSTGSIVFSNSNNVSFGNNASTITASASFNQSVQTQGSVQVQGSTGAVVFSNSNGITFGGNASTITASYTVPSTAGLISAINVSAGTTSNNASAIVFSNSNGVTFGLNGSTITASAAGGGGGAAISAAGSSVSNGTVVFSNSNGVSFGMNGSTITATVNPGAAAGIAAIQVSDTTYTSGTVNFSNANGITFGSSGANGVTINHALQFTSNTSAITSNALNTSASRVFNIVAATNNTGGGTASLSSNVSFSNANGVSFFTSAGSAIVATVKTGYLTTARASNDAIGLNTAQTNVTWTVNSSGLSLNAAGYAGTGTTFAGANISASMTLNSVGLNLSASVNAPGAATLTAYAVSNTTQSTSGTIPGSVLSFQGNGGISVGISGGSVVLSAPALTSLSVTGALSASSNGSTISLGVGTVTVSATSNTTQASSGTINLNAMVLAGAGGVSVGVSNGSLVFSGGAGGGGVNIAASNTTFTSGTVVMSNNGGALTISSGAQSVLFSVPQTSSLVGVADISISVNGSTISISRTQATKSGFNPYGDFPFVADQVGQGSLRLEPMGGMPYVQYDRILIPIVNTNSSNSSGSHTLSFWVGFYTKNVSTLSLASSTSLSTALTHSGTQGSYSLYSGMRYFTIGSTNTLTAGDYVMAFLSRTTSGGADGTYSNILVSGLASNFQGFFGSSNNTTQQFTIGQGIYTATTSGLPASIAYSQLRGSDSVLNRAPYFLLASSTI